MTQGLPAILAEFKRMERKLISLEKSESTKMKKIRLLTEERDEYKAKYEKYVIYGTANIVTIPADFIDRGEKHRLHLEGIIDGMHVRR
jgi:hypothetical protein